MTFPSLRAEASIPAPGRRSSPTTTTRLFDRAISAKDAPGSTFKLCTALAGLASGNLGKDERISDEGPFDKTDTANPAKCWTTHIERHQNQTVVEGLSNSCNYFFYEVSFRTGAQTLNEWAAALGLTSQHQHRAARRIHQLRRQPGRPL